MYYGRDLERAKNDVEKHLGSSVRVRYKNGKKKQKIKDGVLVGAYKSVFLVDLKMDETTYSATSYTYNDLITKNVVITII